MKIMFLNKAYTSGGRLNMNPCKICMYNSIDCTFIPAYICVRYGGFQNTNNDVFEV